MSKFKREGQWDRWAGTLDEIEQVVRYATPLVRSWMRKEPAVEIELTEKSDLSAQLSSVAELRDAVDPRDLAQVAGIEITIGLGYVGPGMRMTFGHRAPRDASSGFSYSIWAPDRASVEGVAREIERVLRPRVHLGVPGLTKATMGAATLTADAIGFGIFALAAWLLPVGWSFAVIGGGLAAAFLAGLVLLTVWASPTFELLAPDQRPKFVRYRGRLFAATGALVLGVISSLIAAPLG